MRDVAVLRKLAKETAKANSDLTARLDAVVRTTTTTATTFAPPPPDDEQPETCDERTPFGLWATTGIALVCVTGFFLAGILYAVVYAALTTTVQSEHAFDTLFEDAGFVQSIGIVAGAFGLLMILVACRLRRGIPVRSPSSTCRPSACCSPIDDAMAKLKDTA